MIKLLKQNIMEAHIPRDSFLYSFTKIDFNDNTIISRDQTTDVSDYFENKFLVNLYRSFEELNLEEHVVEITISIDGHSYTKDIIINKENFYNFYTRYLEYNKEKIISKTLENQITCNSGIINDLGERISKITVKRFDYKAYSLNILDDFSYYEFKTYS